MIRRLNITARLNLAFLTFAALLVGSVSMLAYNNGRDALQAAAISELYSTAIQKEATLDAWVEETTAHTVAISKSPSVRENAAILLAAIQAGSPGSIQSARENLAADLIVWRGAGVGYRAWKFLDPTSGRVIASTDAGSLGKNLADQPFFINGKSDFYFQDANNANSPQGGLLLTVAAPVKGQQGELLGVLAGDMDLEKINEIIIRHSGLRRSDDAYLVNPAGFFATLPAFISDPAAMPGGVHTEAVTRCLTHSNGMVAAPDYNGVPAFVVYRWLPERQLCLVVKMDQSEALAPAMKLRNNILIAGLMSLMMAGLLSLWLSRLISRPLLKLAATARVIGAGNLDVPVEIKSADEIGDLAQAITQMTEDLKVTLVSHDELERRVVKRTAELQAAYARLEKAGRMKDEFLASMSHELRTPLTGVLGLADVLMLQTAGPLNEKQKSYMGHIQKSGRHLLELINDILDLSRIESDQVVLDLRPCSLGLICESGMKITSADAAAKGLHGSFSITPENITFKADARRVKQMVNYLLSNAIKFTSQGGSYGIEVVGDPPGDSPADNVGRWVRIVVWDTGIGIKEADLPRLFQSFVQLDGSLTRQYGGTGLGLALVRRLAEMHGGSVAVESTYGSGSRFTVTLPWNE